MFERLADIDGYGAWLPDSVIFRGGELSDPDSDIRVGTSYLEKTTLGTFLGEVTAYEPPATIAFLTPMKLVGSRVFESRPRYELEETEQGTLVHHFAEGEFFGGWQIFEFAARRLAMHERTRTVDALAESFKM